MSVPEERLTEVNVGTPTARASAVVPGGVAQAQAGVVVFSDGASVASGSAMHPH